MCIGVAATNDNGATPPDHPRESRLGTCNVTNDTTSFTFSAYNVYVSSTTTKPCNNICFNLTIFPTDDKPNLGELEDLKTRGGESINILQRISTEYEKFGIRILADKTGDEVEEIKDEQTVASRIKRTIAQRWLKGNGKNPVTWRTLVEVLDSMGLREVTKEIREALQ